MIRHRRGGRANEIEARGDVIAFRLEAKQFGLLSNIPRDFIEAKYLIHCLIERQL
jgi:hypothetical protein